MRKNSILFTVLLLLLVFCGLFNFFYEGRPPKLYYDHLAKQQNPFTVPNDSAALVWQRAKDFLELRKNMIVGENLELNDSMIFLPYYNEFHRGNSVKIEKHRLHDSTSFFVAWWYSGDSTGSGSKELALFMQQGIDKYNIRTLQTMN